MTRRSLVRVETVCGCGARFVADRLDVIYCSPRCGRAARGMDETGMPFSLARRPRDDGKFAPTPRGAA